MSNGHYWTDKENRAKKAREHTEDMKNRYEKEIRSSIQNSQILIQPLEWPSQKMPEETMVVDTDSVSAIFGYGKGRTAVLNFASFKEPGGMFLQGSRAQEECLCHESTLYNVLSAYEDTYYAENKKDLNRALYRDRLLYAPDIVFEHEGQTAFCDVITCAAPNKTAAKKYCGVSNKENREALDSRIKLILRVANFKNLDTLTLGAFGCGVFGQDPEETAMLFRQNLETIHAADRIIFAVPAGNNDNLTAFRKIFF